MPDDTPTTPATSPRTGGAPEPFVPAALAVPWFEKCLGFLSRRGRARRVYRQVQSQPVATAPLDRVAAALDTLRAAGEDRKPQGSSEVLRFECYLAWAFLERQSPVEAAGRLAALDRDFPDAPERWSLRWRLLEDMPLPGFSALFRDQAILLLSDPQVARHGQAVWPLLARGHRHLSPASWRMLLEGACPAVTADPRWISASRLAACPACFQKTEEAAAWAGGLPPDAFAWSPTLEAEACVVQARAATWRGDWDAMAAWTRRALDLDPAMPAARYWLRRARLHAGVAGWTSVLLDDIALHTPPPTDPSQTASSGSDGDADVRQHRTLPPLLPSQVEPRSADVDPAAWRRLELETRLYEEKTPAVVAGLLAVLEAGPCPEDPCEIDLVLGLFERALASPDARGPDRLPETLTWTRRVLDWAAPWTPKLPWAEVTFAWADVRLHGAYANAMARLAEPQVLARPDAAFVEATARFLGGHPPRPDAEPSPPHLLGRALEGLLRPGAANAKLEPRLMTEAVRAAADPAVRAFPVLAAAADVVIVTWQVLTDGPEALDRLQAIPVPEGIPPWAAYVLVRAAQATKPSLQQAARFEGPVPASPAVAWALETWSANYGPSGAPTPGVAVFPEVGALATECLAAESAVERTLARARSHLAEGRASEALDLLEGLDRQRPALPALAAAFWGPVVAYWRGVAGATLGIPEAVDWLLEIRDGPKGSEARAQLALIALRHGDVDTAERWLGPAAEDYAGVLYARALCRERRGDWDGARARLEELRQRFTDGGPYGAAAARLLASVAERAGDRITARDLYKAQLARDPADRVTAARLGRLLLWTAYHAENPKAAPELAAAAEWLARSTTAIGWVAPFEALQQLLAAEDRDVGPWVSRLRSGETDLPAGPGWTRWLARRFVAAGRPRVALDLLEAGGAVRSSAAHRRSHWLLWTWWLLTEGWRSPEGLAERHAEAIAAFETLDAPTTDGLVSLWARRLQTAHEIADAPGQTAPGLPSINPETDPWLAPIAGLWDLDPAVRRTAAQALQSRLGEGSFEAGSVRQAVLRFLIEWTLEDEDRVVEAYPRLETAMEMLPVAGAAVWSAAATLWLRRRHWKALLDAELPECVADLSLPAARRIIGFAYAHAAADGSLRGDTRLALQRLRQARTALEGLATEGGPDVPQATEEKS